MANVVLKTEDEQTAHAAQTARITPPLPSVPAAASVDAVETSAAAPVATLATAPDSSSSSRRYDQATIEKALAVALQMQQEHQATFSTEQVVRLGEEVNVDRAFMLRALAQLDGTAGVVETTVASAPLKRSTRAAQILASEERHDLTPLPLLSKYMAVIVPFLFSVVSFLIFTAPSTGFARSDNAFVTIWILMGGPMLALFLGAGLKRLRLGLLSGFCMGLFLLVAVLMASANLNLMSIGMFLSMLLMFTAAGSVAGLTGAALPRLYRRALIALVRQLPHLAEAEEAR